MSLRIQTPLDGLVTSRMNPDSRRDPTAEPEQASDRMVWHLRPNASSIPSSNTMHRQRGRGLKER